MKVVVLGAGAMGFLYGLTLQEAGVKVDFVEPYQPSYDALKAQGGVLVSRNGEGEHLVPVNVYTPEEYHETPDLMVVFVKQMQTQSAMERSQHFLGPDTYLLTNQSGLGAVEVLEQFDPRQQIVAGTAYGASILTAPGKVNLMGKKGGPHANFVNATENNDQRTQEIAQLFTDANLKATLQDNYLGTLWDKMMLNSVVNTLGTLTSATMGEFANFALADQMTKNMVYEGYQVAEAAGIKMLRTADQMVDKILTKSKSGNPFHHPSMYQDLKNHRPTEVDYINGHIVKVAREHGVQAPQHELLTQEVHLVEQLQSGALAVTKEA